LTCKKSREKRRIKQKRRGENKKISKKVSEEEASIDDQGAIKMMPKMIR